MVHPIHMNVHRKYIDDRPDRSEIRRLCLETTIELPKDARWREALQRKLEEYRGRNPREHSVTYYAVMILSRILEHGNVETGKIFEELSVRFDLYFNCETFAQAIKNIHSYTRLGYAEGKVLPGLEGIVTPPRQARKNV